MRLPALILTRAHALALVSAIAVVMLLVLLSLNLLFKAAGDATGIELRPLFDPDTGFANQTANCPGQPPATRDADAATLIRLAAAAGKVAAATEHGAVLRSAVAEPDTQTVRFTFSADGRRRFVYVEIDDAFEPGAAGRITFQTQELPKGPLDSAALDLDQLRMGPAAVVDTLKQQYDGTIDAFLALTLASEGCHLVWGVIATADSGEQILARVNNTTGERNGSPLRSRPLASHVNQYVPTGPDSSRTEPLYGPRPEALEGRETPDEGPQRYPSRPCTPSRRRSRAACANTAV